MYPAFDWSVAPGHHGYQRACVLISGQASTGPFRSPVFACAGKTDPPSLLIPLADLGWKRWQAMADTAIIAAVPASNPTGSADALVMTLDIKSATKSKNL